MRVYQNCLTIRKSSLRNQLSSLAILTGLVLMLYAAYPVLGSSVPATGPINSSNVQVAARDVWVDAARGNDSNNGSAPGEAFETIQRAADVAGPGTTVHILPGVYRETIWPAASGTSGQPIIFKAEQGAGTVTIRGSGRASALDWIPLSANTIGLPPAVNPANVYYADLSAWNLDETPHFVVQLDKQGEVTRRLPLAREPDWQVNTEWKYHEFWWAADGGSEVANCNPPADRNPQGCDSPTRSMDYLTDRTNDQQPAGVEPGNLATLGDLTGATIVALDALQSHYQYRRTIVAHDVIAGRVAIDEPAEYDSNSGTPALGWGSKYYIEDKAALLDNPGEWWYDQQSQRLYLWPPQSGNPADLNIEISRREIGFNFKDRSFVILDGLTLEFFNDSAVVLNNSEAHKSYRNTVRNATLRYADNGLSLSQQVTANSPAANIIDGFTLENSEIAYMDTYGLYYNYSWENGSDPATFTRAGIVNTVIRNNELHHLGFRSSSNNPVGLMFRYADQLRFEGNHVHHVAQNGVQFSRSVVQSSKSYGFFPHEIKTGYILIKDNTFEKACLLTSDCGALKIWGRPPDSHVFRQVLIAGNVFRDTFGWSYVSERRGRWTQGTVQGMGGFGLFVDNASGLHAYGNIAYNNADSGYKFTGAWRDGEIIYHKNTAANSLVGFNLGGAESYKHPSVNTQIANNIIINNERFGMDVTGGVDSGLFIDHNLYYNNGWNGDLEGAGVMRFQRQPNETRQYYRTLEQVQAATTLEDHGISGNPNFQSYKLEDHNRHDGSWPNFQPVADNPLLVDRGTPLLPGSLISMLFVANLNPFAGGQAYDIGHHEQGPFPEIKRVYLPTVLH